MQTLTVAAAPEASVAFLDLLNACLIYAHPLVAESGVLLLALAVAASALGQSTRELCRSAVNLLAHLFSPGPRAAASPAWDRYAAGVLAQGTKHKPGRSVQRAYSTVLCTAVLDSTGQLCHGPRRRKQGLTPTSFPALY